MEWFCGQFYGIIARCFMSENPIQKIQIIDAVNQVFLEEFDKSYTDSSMLNMYRDQVIKAVKGVIDGTTKFDDLNGEDPRIVECVLTKLNINKKDYDEAGEVENKSIAATADDENVAVEKSTDESNNVAKRSSVIKAIASLYKRINIPIVRRVGLGVGLVCAAIGVGQVIETCRKNDVDKKDEVHDKNTTAIYVDDKKDDTNIVLNAEIPNPYKIDGLVDDIDSEFKRDIPGLANQLQAQLDYCMSPLPSHDETKIGIQIFSPTRYFNGVYEKFKDLPTGIREAAFASIIKRNMPRCVVKDLNLSSGLTDRKNNFIVLDKDLFNLEGVLTHELNHALLQHSADSITVSEGNTELIAREMLNNGEISAYEKITFRAFLMEFFDPEYLESLYVRNGGN